MKLVDPLKLRSTFHEMSMSKIMDLALPKRGLPSEVNEWRRGNKENFLRGFDKFEKARKSGISVPVGALFLRLIRGGGEELDLGLASMAVLTNTGVNYIVGILNGSNASGTVFKYHGLGTGTNAESAADTALQTELTTQYNPDNTRATGTQTTGGSANVYRTVGVNTVDASAAVTEHGIFSQAATGGGTLLDRSVFSVVNLANTDALQTTYDLTLPSGG